ncbi:MAG: serine protease [Calditrichaeota bacterium]|nr:serine protease [Calditrichota bacterium]
MNRSIAALSALVGVSLLIAGCTARDPMTTLQDGVRSAIDAARSGSVSIEVSLVDSVAESEGEAKRLGAGVVIDPSGTIVTTQNTVEGGRSFVVIFLDGCRYRGQPTGIDRETNLAFLATAQHEHGCYPVTLAIDVRAEPGTIGVVIGHTPITRGVAAAWGVLALTWMGGDDYLSDPLYLIQAGDLLMASGSGVIDLKGRLVGICDNWITGHPGSWTVIPTATIDRVGRHLKANGVIQRGWIGLCCSEVAGGESRSATALRVNEVMPGSPAAYAGILSGSLITAISGEPVNNLNDLRRKITGVRNGTSLKVKLQMENGTDCEVEIDPVQLADDPTRDRRCSSRSI